LPKNSTPALLKDSRRARNAATRENPGVKKQVDSKKDFHEDAAEPGAGRNHQPARGTNSRTIFSTPKARKAESMGEKALLGGKGEGAPAVARPKLRGEKS